MFNGFSVGIHLVDVDTGDARIVGIVVEQIQKIHVRPHIVADGDDLVDDDARRARSRVIWPKNFPSASGPSAMSGLCWTYTGLMNLATYLPPTSSG